MEYIDAPNLGEKQVRRVSISISRHRAYFCQMSKGKNKIKESMQEIDQRCRVKQSQVQVEVHYRILIS